jgi:SAM-dependent methyltransferase
LNRVVAQELGARARHHHGVDDERHAMHLEVVRHRLDQRCREEHARLRRIHADVAEGGVELGDREVRRQLVDRSHAPRGLRRERDKHALAMATGGRKGLQVGLDAGASSRVGGCNRETARDRHAGIIETVTTTARYDGFAEWYDREFATSALAVSVRKTVLRLLSEGDGKRLLDVGCGTGVNALAYAQHGWNVTGLDISEDQLRLARDRGIEVLHADAAAMPFADASFDAAVSTWIHTDVDNFAAVLREIGRVLAPDAPFVYLGAHPCFVGPHSRFIAAEGVPTLHPGYRWTERYVESPGTRPEGLRARVGATHLPLGLFLQSFLDAGFTIDQFEEPGDREYPYTVALRCRR